MGEINSSRLKAIRVTDDEIGNLIMGHQVLRLGSLWAMELKDWPDDAVVRSVNYDAPYRGWLVVFQSEKFDPIASGMAIPLQDVTWTKVEIEVKP